MTSLTHSGSRKGQSAERNEYWEKIKIEQRERKNGTTLAIRFLCSNSNSIKQLVLVLVGTATNSQ
jgi:hypothetical protein